MSTGVRIAIAREVIWTVVKVTMPLLLVSLIIGLIISIFQTITSIREQTLTFVPKMLSIFITLMILGSWMINRIVEFITQLWGNFGQYIH